MKFLSQTILILGFSKYNAISDSLVLMKIRIFKVIRRLKYWYSRRQLKFKNRSTENKFIEIPESKCRENTRRIDDKQKWTEMDGVETYLARVRHKSTLFIHLRKKYSIPIVKEIRGTRYACRLGSGFQLSFKVNPPSCDDRNDRAKSWRSYVISFFFVSSRSTT